MVLQVEQNEVLPQVGDSWYRYEDRTYAAALDEYDMPTGSGRMEVVMSEYRVHKVTPAGVWVVRGNWDTPRFVLRAARKQYASPSKEAALTAYLARKRRQVSILESRAAKARRALELGVALQAKLLGAAVSANHLEELCLD